VAVKAVVFDLDGTLVSFNLDYMVVRAEVRGFLIRSGLPASVLSPNESVFEMLKKVAIFLRNSGKSDRAVEKVRDSVLAIAERYELEAAKTTSLLPGVVEALNALREEGLKLGLCTINGEKSVKYILERFRIAGFFDVLTPRDKVRYVKPNTEHLEATLKDLEVTPAEAVLVGDGVGDMQVARQLGVIAVGLSARTSRKELTASGANYVITSLTDVPTLIRNINQESPA
jgi:HAD superfamily hydrolase (TIGR01549 family)